MKEKIPSNTLCLILGMAGDYIGYGGLNFYKSLIHKPEDEYPTYYQDEYVVFIIKKILDEHGYEYTLDLDGIYIQSKELNEDLEYYLREGEINYHKKGEIIFENMSENDKLFYFIGCLLASMGGRNANNLNFANALNKGKFLEEFFKKEGISYSLEYGTGIPTNYGFEIFDYLNNSR